MTTRSLDEDEFLVCDDPDDFLEEEMDDVDFGEDDLAPEAEDELSFEPEVWKKSIRARQRIEMALEDKWLQADLAEFDFEEIESFDEHFVGGLSH